VFSMSGISIDITFFQEEKISTAYRTSPSEPLRGRPTLQRVESAAQPVAQYHLELCYNSVTLFLSRCHNVVNGLTTVL
jgi:hypothetical protein